MKISPLNIPEILILEPEIIEDSRGFFFESFNLKQFREVTSLNPVFVQDNHSKSFKGVLRGLHYSTEPHKQAKLVRVVCGEILDVAVDIRNFSPTFGMHTAQILSEKNKKQMWIPEGFAHGFLVTSKFAEVIYKATNYYDCKHEKSILWNDPDLNIKWNIFDKPILSLKDQNAHFFSELIL